MTRSIRPILLGALLSMFAGAAFAQQSPMPSPFSLVPDDRAAQAQEAGDATSRVFGGREAKEGEFPFQVALLRADSLTSDPESQYESQFCGGTLIAPDWVLTAAHCMIDDDNTLTPDAFVVLTGTTDLMAGKRVGVAAVFVNEQYDQYSMDHDAALVQLSDKVDLPPVALDYDAAATKAVVIGWGMNEDGDYPRNLLESELDVVPNAECDTGIKNIYATALKASLKDLGSQYRIKDDDVDRIGTELADKIADPLTATMLCAGLKTGQRDSCYGDSGGPLVAMVGGKAVQLGIVSWGEGPADSDVKCGHQDVYGVYSRIGAFKDWIQSHVSGG